MGWRRWLGLERGHPRQRGAPKVRIPAYRQLVPDRLAARVYTHSADSRDGPVPCWSYVTDGLRELGQREIVFTLRRRPGEGDTAFPDGPFEFFRALFDRAEKGQFVEEGDHTQFRLSTEFLGEKGPPAFAYVPTEKLAGVNWPAPPLSAILLTAEEAELTATIGTYRVLTLLGQRHRHYPTPPWSERGRPSVLTRADLDDSLLGKLPVASLLEASVSCRTTQGEDADQPTQTIQLRVHEKARARLAALLAAMAEDASFVLMTRPDPRANARLVWRPGQAEGPVLLSREEAGVVTGGSLALTVLVAGHEDGQEAARVAEDGFLLCLRPATARALRAALREGLPWSLDRAGAPAFELVWEGSAAETVRIVDGVLYQPVEVLRQRLLELEEFHTFLGEMAGAVRQVAERLPPGPGQALTLVAALRPGEQSRFWLEFAPGGVGLEDFVEALQETLRDLPVPRLREGPVAYAAHLLLWGGPRNPSPSFAFLPHEWEQAGEQGAIPDAPLDRLWPPEG